MFLLRPRPSLIVSAVVAASVVSGLAFGAVSAGAALLMLRGGRR